MHGIAMPDIQLKTPCFILQKFMTLRSYNIEYKINRFRSKSPAFHTGPSIFRYLYHPAIRRERVPLHLQRFS